MKNEMTCIVKWKIWDIKQNKPDDERLNCILAEQLVTFSLINDKGPLEEWTLSRLSCHRNSLQMLSQINLLVHRHFAMSHFEYSKLWWIEKDNSTSDCLLITLAFFSQCAKYFLVFRIFICMLMKVKGRSH